MIKRIFKLFKSKVLFGAIAVFVISSTAVQVNAQELSSETNYDISIGGTKTFEILDSDGEIAQVTIQELPNKGRMSNGNYQVSYTSASTWKAGFTVSITSNKIKSAYSPFHTVLAGLIRQPYLIKNSSTKVSYHFTYQRGVAVIQTGVCGYISGNKLYISRL